MDAAAWFWLGVSTVGLLVGVYLALYPVLRIRSKLRRL